MYEIQQLTMVGNQNREIVTFPPGTLSREHNGHAFIYIPMNEEEKKLMGLAPDQPFSWRIEVQIRN